MYFIIRTFCIQQLVPVRDEPDLYVAFFLCFYLSQINKIDKFCKSATDQDKIKCFIFLAKSKKIRISTISVCFVSKSWIRISKMSVQISCVLPKDEMPKNEGGFSLTWECLYRLVYDVSRLVTGFMWYYKLTVYFISISYYSKITVCCENWYNYL